MVLQLHPEQEKKVPTGPQRNPLFEVFGIAVTMRLFSCRKQHEQFSAISALVGPQGDVTMYPQLAKLPR
uniref:Uncharacterized protein n=1 Tax=Hordeum vulgare subsp. vulgare TaxID=112509 RepID=A0A8I7B2K9_HORVV